MHQFLAGEWHHELCCPYSVGCITITALSSCRLCTWNCEHYDMLDYANRLKSEIYRNRVLDTPYSPRQYMWTALFAGNAPWPLWTLTLLAPNHLWRLPPSRREAQACRSFTRVRTAQSARGDAGPIWYVCTEYLTVGLCLLAPATVS